jgi:hypothetical protein
MCKNETETCFEDAVSFEAISVYLWHQYHLLSLVIAEDNDGRVQESYSPLARPRK